MPTQSESAVTVTLIYGGVHVIVVNVIFFVEQQRITALTCLLVLLTVLL